MSLKSKHKEKGSEIYDDEQVWIHPRSNHIWSYSVYSPGQALFDLENTFTKQTKKYVHQLLRQNTEPGVRTL